MEGVGLHIWSVLIGAFGAVAVVIVRSEWNAFIKQDDKRRSRQFEVYSDLATAYNDTKKFRRLLRAKGIIRTLDENGNETKEILRSTYDEQMSSLNDTQLKLEFYCRYIQSNQGQFNEIPDINGFLRPAKNYLGKLIKEYEDSVTFFDSDPPKCALSRLPKLEDCLRPYTESKNYTENFKIPFKKLLDELENIQIGSPSHRKRQLRSFIRGELKRLKDQRTP